MKSFLSKLSAIILLIVIPCVGITTIATSCHSVPLVVTEDNNVNPESLTNGQSVPVPVDTLGGDLGKTLKEEFSKRGTKPVITSENNLLNKPGSLVVKLDAKVTESLLSPELLAVLGATAGSVPVIGPWLKLAIGLTPLLIPNFRNNVTNLVKRTVPGLQGPANDGRVPTLTDFREGVVDIAKALTLAPAASPQVHT